VPEKRGDRLVEQALRALRDALASAGVRWMLIGGLAVVARGVRRMTADVDAVVQGDSVTVSGLVSALAMQGIVPRTRDAIRFAWRRRLLRK